MVPFLPIPSEAQYLEEFWFKIASLTEIPNRNTQFFTTTIAKVYFGTAKMGLMRAKSFQLSNSAITWWKSMLL